MMSRDMTSRRFDDELKSDFPRKLCTQSESIGSCGVGRRVQQATCTSTDANSDEPISYKQPVSEDPLTLWKGR